MLDGAARTATDAGEAIAGELTQLLSYIESMYPSFTGQAGSTFQRVTGELGDELRGILDALNTMANSVHTANRTYASTDEGANQEIANAAAQYSPGSGSVANALRGH